MQKSDLYPFSPTDRIIMPRAIGREVEKLLKNGSICSKLEEIYQIVRDECPEYQHADNSNARKFLTGRGVLTMQKNKRKEGRLVVVRRKIPVTAVIKICDKLGISSGKYIQGKQIELITESLDSQFNVSKS